VWFVKSCIVKLSKTTEIIDSRIPLAFGYRMKERLPK